MGKTRTKWNGGWEPQPRRLHPPRQGGKWKMLMRIFANPNLPQIDDYYEPFTFDYDHLQSAPEMKHAPTARPRSLITGQRMEKIEWGPNWEKSWVASSASAARTRTSTTSRRTSTASSENTFMMYLPRLCEHCLNPACVASCPRLDLQARGRRHRADRPGQVPRLAHVRLGLPLQEDLLQLAVGQGREVHLLLPRIEAGQPTVCSETCVGRIRYLGVLLYDADRIRKRPAWSATDLYQAQLDIFLDPNDPKVIAQARRTASPTTGWKPPAQQPGLQDGRGLEGGPAAAPRVPHAAHGLVRAAALAHPVGGQCRSRGHQRRNP